MGILDKISKMRNEGQSDEEIVSGLKKQGITPKEINEAFSQAQIKNAVSEGEENDEYGAPPEYGYQDSQNPPGNSSPKSQEISEDDTYTPQPSNGYQMQQSQPSQQDYDEYYPKQSGGYDSSQQYYGSGGISTGTVIEISEQVFSENIEKIRKKIEDIEEFKTLSETKIKNLSERLKRIETIIDKLQISILDKVGSYGDNIESIKKEMSMMQDSFNKVISSTHKTTNKKHSEKHTSKKSNSKKAPKKKTSKKSKK